MRKYVWWALLGMLILGLGAAAAAVGDEDYDQRHLSVINTYGATPFVYGGYSYVPLKSAADFLGATLLWDRVQSRATFVYRNRELVLVVGSNTAYFGGRAVALPVPPVLVGQQVLAPVIILDRYFEVPVRWQPNDNRVLILGPPGWGYYEVRTYYGPPPWAPAWGSRRQAYGYPYPQPVYVPMPFVYSGVTYVPLRGVTDVIGASLLWDRPRNRATFSYNGREVGLVIGNRTVSYGPQVIVLSAAPMVLQDTVFVPVDLFQYNLAVPIERAQGAIRIKGPNGWREMGIALNPPAPLGPGPEGERVKSNFGLSSPKSGGWFSEKDTGK